jgi:hypothetical protein
MMGKPKRGVMAAIQDELKHKGPKVL